MTVKEALQIASAKLQKCCDRPQFEAELLLSHHLECDRLYLITHDQERLRDPQGYFAFIERRAAHEPYEYIVGEASFYDIHLQVQPGVLIPRPETELLIDKAAQIIEREKITQIAEIGVGSGAVSVMLARKFPDLKIMATDICEAPLQVASANIARYGLGEQITLRHSNLIDDVPETIELVVSNPPYIADDCKLESNVADYEPHEALFGGRRGDELLKRIIDDVKDRDIGWLVCEMGYDQKAPIQAYVNEIGVKSIAFYKDLAEHDRGFVIDFG